MIRIVAATSLTILLILVLYLPSAFPPERFLGQASAEHVRSIQFWGSEHALRALSRMLKMQTVASHASPVPSNSDAPSQVHRAAANEMAAVNQRLFNNSYFRSIDALLVLALYRFAVLLEWLPLLMPPLVAVIIDGVVVRMIKSKEFLQHSPEGFALYASGSIVTACATVIACVIPIALHPLTFACALSAMGAFSCRAIADFHRRG